jgi:hypothetical protein
MDDTDSKVRQCDIIAVKPVPGYDARVKLIIECKYIKEGHIIFLRDDAQDYCSKREDRKEAIQTYDPGLKKYFYEDNLRQHHYFNPVCLSHTCLTRDKEGGFKLEEDVVFKAISQVIKPMIDHAKNEGFDTPLTYPIIIIGSAEIYEYPIDGLPSIPLTKEGIPSSFEPKNHSCLEYSYTVSPGEKPTTFVVDILKENSFEEYLDRTIKNEINALAAYRQREATAKEIRRVQKQSWH